MNQPFKDNPQLVLRRVTKLPSSTKLDFVFTNKGNSTVTIHVGPIGDVDAFFVELLDGRRIELQGSEGIAILPQRDRIEPGGKRQFSLTFAPLPAGVTRFHVFEGEAAKSGPSGETRLWFFRDVKLR